MAIAVDVRQQAVNLRMQGRTFPEIAAALSIAKSSLSYWKLADLEIPTEARERLAALRVKAARKSFVNSSRDSVGFSHEKCVENGRAVQRMHGDRLRPLLAQVALQNQLKFMPHEAQIADRIKLITGMDVRKECVGGRYFDFCSEGPRGFIVEHTNDGCKGASMATDRFRTCQDSRLRGIITKVQQLGKLRLGRCKDLGIELLSIADFDAGKWFSWQ